MSIHLMFFRTELHARKGSNIWEFPSQVLSDTPYYDHVEIHVETGVVCQMDGKIYAVTKPNPKYRDNYRVTRVRIDTISLEEILATLDRLQKVGAFKTAYRMSDYRYMSTRGHCPRSLLLTGFTCATLVAYILGYHDYWKMVPDNIYNSLR